MLASEADDGTLVEGSNGSNGSAPLSVGLLFGRGRRWRLCGVAARRWRVGACVSCSSATSASCCLRSFRSMPSPPFDSRRRNMPSRYCLHLACISSEAHRPKDTARLDQLTLIYRVPCSRSFRAPCQTKYLFGAACLEESVMVSSTFTA